MNRSRGFTLLELMITVAIVAILASIALPMYSDYVKRGNIADATSKLMDVKVRMEQWYATNRTYYLAVGGTSKPTPCASSITTDSGTFAVDCTINSNDSYTLTAQGQGGMSLFKYTITETGAKGSVITAAGWACTSTSVWFTRKGMSCPP